MSEARDRDALLQIFLAEAFEAVAALECGLDRGAERDPAGREELRVVAHRLKGSAALYGFPGFAELASAAETLLEAPEPAWSGPPGAAAARLAALVPLLKRLCQAVAVTGQEDPRALGEAAVDAVAAASAAAAPGSAEGPGAPPNGPAPGAPPGVAGGAANGAALPAGAGGAAPAAGAPPRRAPAIEPEVLSYFVAEAAEHLEHVTGALAAIEAGDWSDAPLAAALRALHTVKGAAHTVGHGTAAALAHQVEEVLVAVRDGRLAGSAAVLEAAFEGAAALRRLVAAPGDQAAEGGAARAIAALVALAPAAAPEVPPPSATPVTPDAGTAAASPRPAPTPPARRPDAGPVNGGAPAAAEPGEPSGPAARPSIRVAIERLDAVAELTGELILARNRLDPQLRQLERLRSLLAASRSRIASVVKDFERTRHRRGPAADRGPAAPPEGPPDLFGDLELDRYDDTDLLARSLAEISADLGEVHGELGAATRALASEAGTLQQLAGRLRAEITRTRMVPVSTLFARLRPQFREAARAAGKSVVLTLGDQGVELDTAIVERLADPVLHLLQNAIVHGIEPEDERLAGGKPLHGTVRLSAAHRGGVVCLEVVDDGRGVDVPELRARAVRQGLVPAAVARRLTDAEALDLMFLPGVSTAETVTTAAGRGLGMDVVRTNVARVNGRVAVSTEPGAGTRVTLTVPLTMITSETLLLRIRSETVALPMRAVQKIVMALPHAIEAREGAESIVVDDRPVPVLRLDQLLGVPSAEVAGRRPVVLLQAGDRVVATVVDEIVGKEENTVRSVGAFLDGLGPFAGVTVSAEGRVIFVLDPDRLLEALDGDAGEAAGTGGEGAHVEGAPPPPTGGAPPRVLLVDDSLSVRKFVGHMLERAGLEVVTAADGAEALERVTEAPFQVVITDLEMPRVNGFELIQDLRRRPATRDVPVVVLTTRAGAKHLNLARWLGVDHYLAKPVEEGAFVRLIASLAGPAVAPLAAGAA